MIVSMRADKIQVGDRLVRPNQSITPEVVLTRMHDNTVEMHWWQSVLLPMGGLVVIEDFVGCSDRVVALRVNRYTRLDVLKPD